MTSLGFSFDRMHRRCSTEKNCILIEEPHKWRAGWNIFGVGFPFSADLEAWGTVVSSSEGQGARNAFWRILKVTKPSFLHTYDSVLCHRPIWEGGKAEVWERAFAPVPIVEPSPHMQPLKVEPKMCLCRRSAIFALLCFTYLLYLLVYRDRVCFTGWWVRWRRQRLGKL